MSNKAASTLLAFFMGVPLVAPAQPLNYRLEVIPTFDEPNPETLGLAFAINELGEAVGISEDAQFMPRGFLYQAGQLKEVPGFGAGLTSDVRAINNFAEVAGGAMMNVVFNGHPGAMAVPFVKSPGGPPRTLLTNDEIHRRGIGGYAYGLNDAGMVGFEGGGSWVALPDGQRVEWGFLQFPGDYAGLGSMNNRGQIVGYGVPQDALGFEAVLFDLNTRTAVNLNDRTNAHSSFANDINEAGVIVGEWRLNSNGRTVPVLWEKLVPRQLPFVHEETPGWVGRTVAINDHGDVLGESQHLSGERLNWLLFAGVEIPIPLLDLVAGDFFEHFDDFLAFDLNNSRELVGAAIKHVPDAPFGSTNKPAILRPMIAAVPPAPAPGLWADPARPGAGIEINRAGGRHYLIWYTYDESGLPTWYFSDAIALVRDGWRAELYRFTRNAAGAVLRQSAGQVVLSSRSESALTFSWRLGGRGGSESYRYLAGDCAAGAKGVTGTWYNPDSPGFGVSLQHAGTGLSAVFYFYDVTGRARWVFVDFANGARAADAWLFTGGSCPGCAPRSPSRAIAGTAELVLVGGRVELNMNLPVTAGLPALGWHSANAMAPLSAPAACGFW